MDENVSVWKANLTNGLIMGLLGVVFTLGLYFFDLLFNRSLGYIFLVVQVIILYYMLKSYRDNYRHGYLTYGQSLGAGVVIFLYQAVISAVFTYILYKFIDTSLTAKMLAFSEDAMVKRGMSQQLIDAGMAFNKKIMIPELMAPFSIFGTMIAGTIISLIVSIFTRKEGNPLVDVPSK
jgi:hypothetical protein